MRQALLVSVAAVALAAGSTLALSQGSSGGGQGPAGPGGGASMQKDSGPSGGPSGGATGSTQKDHDAGPQKKGAQDHTGPQPSQRSTQERQDRPGASGTQQKSTQERQDRPGASDTQKSTQDRQQRQDQPGTQQRQQTQSPTQQRQTESPQQPGSKQGQSAQQPSTGGTKQGAQTGTDSKSGSMQSSNVSLTTEQKTTIRNTVITSGPKVTNVNFSISVGTVVPRTVRVAPVPVTLVEIRPEWRGHMYFVYEDEIIIVDARTLKIIAVLEV